MSFCTEASVSTVNNTDLSVTVYSGWVRLPRSGDTNWDLKIGGKESYVLRRGNTSKALGWEGQVSSGTKWNSMSCYAQMGWSCGKVFRVSWIFLFLLQGQQDSQRVSNKRRCNRFILHKISFLFCMADTLDAVRRHMGWIFLKTPKNPENNDSLL